MRILKGLLLVLCMVGLVQLVRGIYLHDWYLAVMGVFVIVASSLTEGWLGRRTKREEQRTE